MSNEHHTSAPCSDSLTIEQSRRQELAILSTLFEPSGPDIIGVHGIAGVGKTTLINAWLDHHSNRCVRLDCRLIEPTPRAFLHEIARLTQAEQDADSIPQALTGLHDADIDVIILDQFELLNLLESWLRLEFLPSSDKKIKLIFCGRLPPDNQWLFSPPSGMSYQGLKVSGLPTDIAVQYLCGRGHDTDTANAINHFAQGHPLALRLASNAILEQPTRSLSAPPASQIIHTLAQYFIEDIQDADLTNALYASSVVRRITEPLLSAMLDTTESQSATLYQTLTQLDVVEIYEDGCSLHETLRNALSSELKIHSPDKYRIYRHRASQWLMSEFQSATYGQMWRYTADLLYLIENRVIRDAFFPPFDKRAFSVEPAIPSDENALMAIIKQHEPEALEVYERWWHKQTQAFHCVKDASGAIVGFYCLLKPKQIPVEQLYQDPLTRYWLTHLSDSTLRRDDHEHIFIRRWLSMQEGESLSAVQAACWLDIKRTYLELNPKLQRVYLTLNDLKPYATVASQLGFQVLEQTQKLGSRNYFSAMLNMGPGSVTGWIASHLIREIEDAQSITPFPEWFDTAAKQLRFGGTITDLTPLEFGTLHMLIEQKGTAISRKSLLSQVWGIEYDGASNVVDTIILSLRKKMKSKAKLIQSVRGTGYRFTDSEHDR
ncbi:winged helix-turn-helix domain-containing protein [Vibrio hangzhouensis]|uniref:winged helix-turn-helix domain-containing protein n=1 Tax=Vibrio hangzhouensis TaxID=462991 RepID=UPI001C9842F2|nr:winged helix-turn-helix domain-containing protein [Vibrio hangzhouensis]MBY6199386.1 winged helix-turn-helix domain-containing protein [Vibrio hangzhouensis]